MDTNISSMDFEKDFEEDLEEEIEEGITEKQAQRLVEWLTIHGHTMAEACSAFAYVVGAYDTPDE